MSPAHSLRLQQLASLLLNLAQVWDFHQMRLSWSLNRFPPVLCLPLIFLSWDLTVVFSSDGGKASLWEDCCLPGAASRCSWGLGMGFFLVGVQKLHGLCRRMQWALSSKEHWALPQGLYWLGKGDVSLESPPHHFGEVSPVLWEVQVLGFCSSSVTWTLTLLL